MSLLIYTFNNKKGKQQFLTRCGYEFVIAQSKNITLIFYCIF